MRCVKLILILLFLSGVAYGQVPFKGKPKPKPAAVYNAHAKKKSVRAKKQSPARPPDPLTARVLTTYRRAKRAQDHYPEIADWGGPSRYFTSNSMHMLTENLKFNRLNPKVLYPHTPLLSSEQLIQCFLVQHNLELIKWMPKQEEIRQYIVRNIPVLQKHQVKVSSDPQQDMSWLAQQITPETKNLLIGEVHNIEIGQMLPEFLRELRRAQGDRQIFLFTEFLPEGAEWGHLKAGTLYFPDQEVIWDAAYEQRMTVIGLEPHFTYVVQPQLMERNPFEQGRATPGNSFWESLAGVRFRNQRWMRLLEKYRAQYPEALFVIYAGNAHVSYSEPYSLGSRLASENTLVALLFPEEYFHQPTGDRTLLTSKFDAWTNGKFLDRIVQFDLPVLSHVVGFDIRIRMPGITHEIK